MRPLVLISDEHVKKGLTLCLALPGLIMDAIQSTAGTIRQQLGNPEMPPNPAFLYVLPNQARFRPNLYIFQRTYQGTWSVDLFFDSKSAPARLEGRTFCRLFPRKHLN